MGRCTDRRDMTKAVESGVKLQTNKTNHASVWLLRVLLYFTFIVYNILNFCPHEVGINQSRRSIYTLTVQDYLNHIFDLHILSKDRLHLNV